MKILPEVIAIMELKYNFINFINMIKDLKEIRTLKRNEVSDK